MERYEWKIGDVVITVEAPEDVLIDGASVRVAPQDREEFLRAVEAVGGLEGLTFPRCEESFAQAALAYGPLGRGTTYVAIFEPPRDRAPATPAPHPFFARLEERRARETARGAGVLRAGEPSEAARHIAEEAL